jgi:hypothetical protein
VDIRGPWVVHGLPCDVRTNLSGLLFTALSGKSTQHRIVVILYSRLLSISAFNFFGRMIDANLLFDLKANFSSFSPNLAHFEDEISLNYIFIRFDDLPEDHFNLP